MKHTAHQYDAPSMLIEHLSTRSIVCLSDTPQTGSRGIGIAQYGSVDSSSDNDW